MGTITAPLEPDAEMVAAGVRALEEGMSLLRVGDRLADARGILVQVIYAEMIGCIAERERPPLARLDQRAIERGLAELSDAGLVVSPRSDGLMYDVDKVFWCMPSRNFIYGPYGQPRPIGIGTKSLIAARRPSEPPKAA